MANSDDNYNSLASLLNIHLLAKISTCFLRPEGCDNWGERKVYWVTQYQNPLLFHNWIIGIPMVLEDLIIVMPHGIIISFSFQTWKLNSEVSMHIRSSNVNKPCYFRTWKISISGLSWHSPARTHRLGDGEVVYSSSLKPTTLYTI